ncbi:hypothetical protein [uncultured Tenacibaculum sp.]|uniref:hypothetical protein n=1 Tax=uncultured Tenacibaculum sp. TaxID=174713 RepID=UPI002628F944|nr:hypothetical protein [uncultured Tenacibaculum sp.]
MKTNSFIISLIFSVLFLSSCNTSKQNDFPSIKDRYFEQKLPDLIPEVFAPSIVSVEEFQSGISFSPNMKEIYFVRRGGKYEKRTNLVIQFENNEWKKESVTNIRYPSFSPDGDTIFKGNKYRKRTKLGWSEPKSIGDQFKDIPIMRLSTSSIGTRYFDEATEKGTIRFSRLIDGKYEEPQIASKEINTGKWVAHPYIAPDESYLMWDAERNGGYGDSDLYISFRQKDGSWGAAINMGNKINTVHQENGAQVTPDGKYLFFWRGYEKFREDGSAYWVGNPYWLDVQIIENLRPKK